jgi:DNA integrity scanning protein DisA with diadenylate cyclase activity
LGIEVLIERFVHNNFVRLFLGDVLVVVLLYAACRTILKSSSIKIVFGAVLFAFLIEFAQYLQLSEKLNLAPHSIGQIILGSTFDPLDLLAYFLGGGASYLLSSWLENAPNTHQGLQ